MSKTENRRMGRAAGVVGLFTFSSRILGLVRDMVLASYFGSGMVADAFFVAFRIPNLLRRLFGEGSLTVAFIPVFTEYLTVRSRDEAYELARVGLTLLSILLVLLTVAGVIFSPWIVRMQAFGFGSSGEKYELTVLLTRITFPYVLLVSVVAFFMGVLNSFRHFAAPAAAPLLLNLGIIGATFLLSPHLAQPIVGVAAGVLIGGILQVALQLPVVYRYGLRLYPSWQPKHPAVRRIVLLLIPALFGSAVYQFNQFLGTLFASFLPEGSVSWLYYADRLVQFPLGVFGIAISTAALPSLATQAAENVLEEFANTFSHALGMVLFITLPSMAGLLVLGGPIIRVFFERGLFDAYSTSMTNQALIFYTVGLWAFSGIRVMVSAFYALQDTVTPVKAAVVSLLANLLFSLALMGPLRHGGLALALSLASSIQFCLLAFLLRRKVRVIAFGPVLISACKSLLSTAVMTVGIILLLDVWTPFEHTEGIETAMNLAALIGMGALLYFGAAKALGSPELSILEGVFRSKTWRRMKARELKPPFNT